MIKNPVYPRVFELQKKNRNAIFLELACCCEHCQLLLCGYRTDLITGPSTSCTVGQECRKLIQDGFPPENIVATDIQQGMLLLKTHG